MQQIPALGGIRYVAAVSEFWAALLGALVGGALTYVASARSTTRVLEAESVRHGETLQAEADRHAETLRIETALAREAAAEERKAAREAVSRRVATELLVALSDIDDPLHYLGGPRPIQEHDNKMIPRAHDTLRRSEAALVPLLPVEAQKRFSHLRTLFNDLSVARAAQGEPDRADWTIHKIARSREDIRAYLNYVRATLVAVVDNEPIPEHKDMPYLRRVDMAVWTPPGAVNVGD